MRYMTQSLKDILMLGWNFRAKTDCKLRFLVVLASLFKHILGKGYRSTIIVFKCKFNIKIDLFPIIIIKPLI